VICCTGGLSVLRASQGSAGFENSVKPFLAKNCFVCHNPKLQSGNLNLQAFADESSAAAHRDTWELVVHKLTAGEMPPKGLPRPKEAEKQAFLAYLQAEFDREDQAAQPDPGHVTARRLNRSEYNNTVRDLFGVDIHPADDFPPDSSGYGFDNIGDVLSLSPVLMERYLGAAEHVVRAALFGPAPLKPALSHYGRPHTTPALDAKPGVGPRFTVTDYDLTGLTMPNALHVEHNFPVDGDYVLEPGLLGYRPRGSESAQVGIWIDGKMVHQVQVDPLDTGFGKITYNGQGGQYRGRITAGTHRVDITILRQYEGLPVSVGGFNPSLKPVPPPPDLTLLKPPPGSPPDEVAAFYTRQAKAANAPFKMNSVSVDTVDIAGPYDEPTGPSPESLKRVYVCGHLDGHHQSSCARKIVAAMQRRAWRRPVSTAEVARILSIMSTVQEQGASYEEGLAASLEAILVSPKFLFRVEDVSVDTQDRPHPVTQFELASRLSYFLWSSTPDDELLKAADRGVLRKPDVLAAQVRRMLKDCKSEALVENFGGQWLETRRLESVQPDPQKFPQFDAYLRWSMKKETEMFIEDIIREDKSVLDLLDGKYTFVNERLAQHYGMAGIKGPEFRKVDLSGTPRGGVLTQASVLTTSSYPTRTSVVLRGKWVLENLLNAPVPPPPPDVPNLDEAAVGTSMSLRQQMEKHRANAVCASCHSRMDPLGFGLENFNAVGEWRDKDGKFPVDASGTLPDGRSFLGPEQLEKVLVDRRVDFTEGITEKMLTYALGRGIERYDKRTVKEIARNLAANNYKFSSLVLNIIESLPFQQERGDRKKL
jgi:hypothetical protein